MSTDIWQKPKLPFKTAFKIGCSNFKYHPVRLSVTVLLSVISFTLFGISLNVTFNEMSGLDVSVPVEYLDVIEMLKNITYIVAGIFAFFAVCLLCYFMIQSVSEKSRTIGILKANGCNNLVLSKIFISEGLMIACAVFALTSVFAAIACACLNVRFKNLAVFRINLWVYPVLAVVIFFVAALGSLIPIIQMRKLLPNDVIRKI